MTLSDEEDEDEVPRVALTTAQKKVLQQKGLLRVADAVEALGAEGLGNLSDGSIQLMILDTRRRLADTDPISAEERLRSTYDALRQERSRRGLAAEAAVIAARRSRPAEGGGNEEAEEALAVTLEARPKKRKFETPRLFQATTQDMKDSRRRQGEL